MPQNNRPNDPFSKLGRLGTDQKLFDKEPPQKKPVSIKKGSTSKSTRTRDSSRDKSRNRSRNTSRDNPRGKSRSLPTRNEIQEFSFRLRDELRVKVQAELPPKWQKELDAVAQDLDVKKLELYRFIFGEFLRKVRRKKPA